MKHRVQHSVGRAAPRRANPAWLVSCLVVVVAAAAIVSFHAGHVGAISDGVPDTQHPNVGAMLVEWDPAGRPGELAPQCTGSLLSPNHFLTSAHCLSGLAQSGLGPQNIAVTFDQNALAPDRVVGARDVVIHPNALQRRSSADDVAVVILETPVLDIEPVDLPTEGFLDQAAAGGGLVGHSFVVVGYGVVPNDRGRPGFEFDGSRSVATSR